MILGAKLASNKTTRSLFSSALVECDAEDHATISPTFVQVTHRKKPLVVSDKSTTRQETYLDPNIFLFQNCWSTIYPARWIWECTGKLAVILVKRTFIYNEWLVIILLKTRISIKSAQPPLLLFVWLPWKQGMQCNWCKINGALVAEECKTNFKEPLYLCTS